jgi:hypothetical protein
MIRVKQNLKDEHLRGVSLKFSSFQNFSFMLRDRKNSERLNLTLLIKMQDRSVYSALLNKNQVTSVNRNYPGCL